MKLNWGERLAVNNPLRVVQQGFEVAWFQDRASLPPGMLPKAERRALGKQAALKRAQAKRRKKILNNLAAVGIIAVVIGVVVAAIARRGGHVVHAVRALDREEGHAQVLRQLERQDGVLAGRVERDEVLVGRVEEQVVPPHAEAAVADGAREEFGFLDDGKTDFAVTVGVQHLARDGFDALPALHRFRQQVIHAPYGLYGLAHWTALNRLV